MSYAFSRYTSTNNVAANPFLLNRINLTATYDFVDPNAKPHLVAGNEIALVGNGPRIVQSGTGNVSFTMPIRIDGTFTASGTGVGLTTLDGPLSGIANILKEESSHFRFGSPDNGIPSGNTWVGKLQINAGTVRFNNNADSGRTALRANPVSLGGLGAAFTCNSEMRFGTLTGGAFSDVRTTPVIVPPATNADSESILITAFEDGEYAGSFTLAAPVLGGDHDGELIIRGTATQTLSGTVNVDEDIVIGRGATLVMSGNASFSTSTGSVVMGGGTLRLENENANNDNRLREGGAVEAASTSVQPIGGGTLILAGNAAGTYETTGRLQLGSGGTTLAGAPESHPRAGHLNLQIVHRASGAAETTLMFQNYSRDQQTISQVSTVNFSATDDSSTPQFLLLGDAGNAPHIYLTDGAFVPPLLNGLLSTTDGGAGSVGWATIYSPSTVSTNATVDFATHTVNGVAPVTTTLWAGASATDNVIVTAGAATPATGANFPVNSVKLEPTGLGQSLNIAGTGNLATTAILLSGANDYTIRSSGGGGIAGAGSRFFHVDKAALTVEASLAASNQPVVKSGNGLLALTNSANGGVTALTVVNGGTLRATPGTTLPAGELRLRGGVLEIQGGGTFSRTLGQGAGTMNLSGVTIGNISDDDDRGSGGFAAFGADATVTLNGSVFSFIFWEDVGFARSGHALILNSPTANAMVDFTNPIVLHASSGSINYNAREIRVMDNPAVTTDWARISSQIHGNVNNDLLKTGEGTLELTHNNQYLGHTHVNEGRLLVTGSLPSAGTVITRGSGAIGGAGTVGTILLDGGGVSPGNGLGTLNAAALYWRNGTYFADLGVGNNTSDVLNLGTGRFHKDPHGTGPAQERYKFNLNGTGEGGRTYTLATFGSTTFTQADANNFQVANLRSGLTGGTFTITGNTLTFTTNLPAPVVATHPLSQRININTPVTFSVAPLVPGTYTYEWYHDNQLIPGESGSTLTIQSLVAADAGQYHAVIKGPSNATSNSATLIVNEAPVGTPHPTHDVVEDTGFPFTIAATDVNGDAITLTVSGLPAHGALSGTLPNLIYTPALNYNGPDSIVFKARDGSLDSFTTVNFNVTPVNDNPTPIADAIISDVPFDLIANDTDVDGDAPLTLQSVGTAAYGTLAQDGNSVTYTAGPLFSRSDTFTYVVTDGNGGTAVGTATVGLGAPTSFGITGKGVQVFGEPAGTLLTVIGQPTVGGDGRVAFVGTYVKPDKKKETALLFGNPPVPVVRLGVTTAPGTTLTFSKITAPVVNATGQLAFKGVLAKAPSGTAEGIWVIDNGVIRTVARGGMVVPEITGVPGVPTIKNATFAKLGDIVIPDDGRVIFAATIKGPLKTFDTGIWRETGNGTVAKVVIEGEFIRVGGRDRAVTTIAPFGPSGKDTIGQRRGFNNGGSVIARVGFSDKSSAIVRFNADGSEVIGMFSDSPRSEVADSKVKSFGLPVLAEDGGMSFFASLIPGSGNASATSDTVIFRRSAAGTVTLVAQESSPAANIQGSAFKSFSDTVSGNGNRVGFIGTLKTGGEGANKVTKANDVGIWRHSAAGALEPLAREGSPAPGPGLTGANFVSFKSLAWTNRIAFVGTAKSATSKITTTGLWAEDSTGTLNLIFHTGKTVALPTGSKTVKSFIVLGSNLGALGQGGSANFLGGYAILATFTDKTVGVVTTWVP